MIMNIPQNILKKLTPSRFNTNNIKITAIKPQKNLIQICINRISAYRKSTKSIITLN